MPVQNILGGVIYFIRRFVEGVLHASSLKLLWCLRDFSTCIIDIFFKYGFSIAVIYFAGTEII